MPKTELTVEECLVVDRKRKRYAFFLEDEQPERIARQYENHIRNLNND